MTLMALICTWPLSGALDEAATEHLQISMPPPTVSEASATFVSRRRAARAGRPRG